MDIPMRDLLELFVIITGLTGQVLVTKKRVEGFHCWIASNVAYMGLHYLDFSLKMIILHAIYLTFCVWGAREWRAEKPAVRTA